MMAIAVATPLAAQDVSAPAPQTGNITGTVSDVNNDVLSGATVVLEGPGLTIPRKVLSDDNGFFEFGQLGSGTYHIAITAEGFADWSSTDLVLSPSQYMILPASKLLIAKAVTAVNVSDSSLEVATEQVKVEEAQRVLGIIPNFYVVYEQNPAPLTTKLKFQLALKTSSDAATVLGIGVLAGINQAGDTPDYVQGAKGYAQRYGAAAADGFSDIMIGGAILPSLLHQDPRYYYQGTGSNTSRTFHALSSPFICKGDNGRLQPNYSSLGGDLSSAALSNTYYPASNRGTSLVFQNFFIATGERMLSSVLQEFVLHKLTSNREQ